MATRNVTVSRKVSKISATTAGLPTADPKRGSSTPLSSISPSIRQLTEKFSSSAGAHKASPTDGAAVTRGSSTLPRARCFRGDGSRKSFHEDSSDGYFHDSDTTTEFHVKSSRKFHSGTDSVSSSDSEKKNGKRIFRCLSTDSGSSSGKRDYSHISTFPTDHRKTLTTDEEEDVASKPFQSHRSHFSTHHCDFIPQHSDNWPSVTKIRQLFDARQSEVAWQQKTDTCEQLKAADRGDLRELGLSESVPYSDGSERLLPYSSAKDTSLSLQSKCIEGAQSRDISATKTQCCYDMDFYPNADSQLFLNEEDADIERANKNTFSGTTSFQSRSRSSSSHSCTGGSHSHEIKPPPCRTHSPSTETEATHKTLRTTDLTSDPNSDLQPPVTSSWSQSESLATFSCSSLQQPTVRERKDRQGVGLPRDSLHSSHSSSRTLAPTTSSSPSSVPAPDKADTSSSSVAPSTELRARARVARPLSPRWRFSSGDEEEEQTRRRKGGVGDSWSTPSLPSTLSFRVVERDTTEQGGSSLLCSNNGWWGAKGTGRSSGSEDDSPDSLGPHSREAVRRRSLRKKKKASGISLATGRDDYNDNDGESEDSDSDTALTMEHIERYHQQNTGGEFTGTRPHNHSVRELISLNNKARVQQWERISSPVRSATLPGVSRVSKVNIPPFISSPGGSRCSSRYSSSETLKEEDQASHANRVANSRIASSSMLSKTYHGNFTMYRSPSFGHGDNFSRAPLRMRPRIVPTVTSIPTVLSREGSVSTEVGGGETRAKRTADGNRSVSDDKNQIYMSNPDITSETMSLLSFLKSDLSELKARKKSGDKSGVVKGSAACRTGSRTHGGTLSPSGHRPSLKDLTATLRRAKSFTYSDKPSVAVRRCFTGGAAKRSNSEQQLDLDGERLLSDREVESDGGDFRVGRGQRMRHYYYEDDEEVVPHFHERYVQEARQVIQDICQMSSREDDDDTDVRGTDSILEDEFFQVSKANEAKQREGMSAEDKAITDHEFKNTKDGDKLERERESEESSRRDGQNMQLEELCSRGTDDREKAKRESRETERALLQGTLEEKMFYNRSVDELSGHESSLTDEGIVTEPEMGISEPSEKSFLGLSGVNLGSCLARDVLGQPVTTWMKSALHDTNGCKKEREDVTENALNGTDPLNEGVINSSLLLPAHMTDSNSITSELNSTGDINNINAPSEDIGFSDALLQKSAGTAGGGGGLETPATPNAIRRRRKFTPHGNNNTFSESSNAESTAAVVGNGESTVYRSLSDPMPQRRCSVAEEENNNFSSVDSNLLGSLSVKGGGGCSPEAPIPEYKGSVASDLSLYSDSGLRDDVVHDYSGVIRSIVAEPGAMDRLMADDNGNSKAPKKKSFSDPSRRSDAPLLSQNDAEFKGQTGNTQPICELDQPGQIPPSSSEPILSEQREELWEPHHHAHSNKARNVSQSECSPLSDKLDGEDDDVTDQGVDEKEMKNFNIDLKLAGLLSPRVIRRTYRKRPNRLAQCFPHEGPFEQIELDSGTQEDHSSQTDITPAPPPPPMHSNLKTRPKHVRHTSEPTTFVPISSPLPLQPLKEVSCLGARDTAEPPSISKPPGDQAPSLEDVTQKYTVEPRTAEKDSERPGPLVVARDGASVSASERPGETGSSGITETAPQKKSTEDTASMATTQKTKPRVVSPHLFFCFYLKDCVHVKFGFKLGLTKGAVNPDSPDCFFLYVAAIL